MTAALADFDRTEVTYDGVTKTVFRRGSGPAVIVMHEIPSLHPGVLTFGQRVVDAGFTVYMPSLFGEAGVPVATSASRATISRSFAGALPKERV